MASTRELVTYVLRNDQETSDWFEANHGFSVEKAEKADLSLYSDLVAGIINEGLRKNILTRAQVDGSENR